jgi:hypothetical protein
MGTLAELSPLVVDDDIGLSVAQEGQLTFLIHQHVGAPLEGVVVARVVGNILKVHVLLSHCWPHASKHAKRGKPNKVILVDLVSLKQREGWIYCGGI